MPNAWADMCAQKARGDYRMTSDSLREIAAELMSLANEMDGHTPDDKPRLRVVR